MLPVKLALPDWVYESMYDRRDREEEKRFEERVSNACANIAAKNSPPKPTACASVFQEWKEVTLKNGTKVPLLQEYKFCAEGDTYVEAQKSAEAKAKQFLDGIEAEKVDRERRAHERFEEVLRESRCISCQPKF